MCGLLVKGPGQLEHMVKAYKMPFSRAEPANVPRVLQLSTSFLATMPTPVHVRKGYAQMPLGQTYYVRTVAMAAEHLFANPDELPIVRTDSPSPIRGAGYVLEPLKSPKEEHMGK